MKKFRIFASFFIVAALVYGAWLLGPSGRGPEIAVRSSVSKNAPEYTGIEYTPWDVSAASRNITVEGTKPYTIMLYMNGSDLESESGAATDDIVEILNSGVDSNKVNVVIFTGGTNRWQNNVVPDNECVIWKAADGFLYKLCGVGLVNMGDAGTLKSFIDFSVTNFPADKYGLIMWDHGGGSIAGYGHDEKFYESNLNLLEMNYAFKMSKLAGKPLEFLGFDSCLMATVEMANLAADYARYLVASEDLEPGDGWNYRFLSVLNREPSMDGAKLGKAITDYYMAYYGPYSHELLTMSVVDLSKVDAVATAMGRLMDKCSAGLKSGQTPTFTTLALRRVGTKTFGEGSPRDNESDMVDAGDMAMKLHDLFPSEASKVLEALDKCVVYNRHNSGANLRGLSAYYIYGGRNTADKSLATYAALKMDKDYTDYLTAFASILTKGGRTKTRSGAGGAAGDIPKRDEIIWVDLTLWQPAPGENGYVKMTGIIEETDYDPSSEWKADKNTPWPFINGQGALMYKTGESGTDNELYAIPAERNGKDCDIIVLINKESPKGKVLGARQKEGFIIQKGYDKIKDGDTLSLYYPLKKLNGRKLEDALRWHKAEAFTVQEELKLEWRSVGDVEAYYALLTTDIRRNEYFTEVKKF